MFGNSSELFGSSAQAFKNNSGDFMSRSGNLTKTSNKEAEATPNRWVLTQGYFSAEKAFTLIFLTCRHVCTEKSLHKDTFHQDAFAPHIFFSAQKLYTE